MLLITVLTNQISTATKTDISYPTLGTTFCDRECRKLKYQSSVTTVIAIKIAIIKSKAQDKITLKYCETKVQLLFPKKLLLPIQMNLHSISIDIAQHQIDNNNNNNILSTQKKHQTYIQTRRSLVYMFYVRESASSIKTEQALLKRRGSIQFDWELVPKCRTTVAEGSLHIISAQFCQSQLFIIVHELIKEGKTVRCKIVNLFKNHKCFLLGSSIRHPFPTMLVKNDSLTGVIIGLRYYCH